MKILSTLRLSVCLPLCLSMALPSMSFASNSIDEVKSSLEERMHSILKQPQNPQLQLQIESSKNMLTNYQVVFVTGFFGRAIVNYFTQPMNTMRDSFGAIEGLKAPTQTDAAGNRVVDMANVPPFLQLEVRPTSMKSTQENTEYLYRELTKFHARNPKPIILVAHSKGAAETLRVALTHPDLIQKGIVGKIILLNAALGGSYIADYVDSNGLDPELLGAAVDTAVTKNPAYLDTYHTEIAAEVAEPPALGELLVSGQYSITSLTSLRYILPDIAPWGGLVTMRRSVAREVMANALSQSTPEQIQQLNQHLFYARAYSTPKSTSALLNWIGIKGILDKLGKNDGVILLKDQCIQGVGQDLGTIQHADHGALVSISKLNNGEKDIVEAFTKTLFTSTSVFPELLGKPGYTELSIESPTTTVTSTDNDGCTLLPLPKASTAPALHFMTSDGSFESISHSN